MTEPAKHNILTVWYFMRNKNKREETIEDNPILYFTFYKSFQVLIEAM